MSGEEPGKHVGPALPGTGEESGSSTEQRGILSSGAVMAAGTVVSRLSGYVRSVLLVAALGSALHADIFNIANTIPNMLYILLAGGVINAVLVPQLVRAMKLDEDGGDAYTNRIITLAGLFLLLVTVLLVIAAPLVMRVLLSSSYDLPELAAQRQSAITFARFCLPQVFFYGMFVLVGQILNARGRFGPMMWAPIANNVISVLVLVSYLVIFGKAQDICANPDLVVADHNQVLGPFSLGQEALLGLGSTLGIAVQFLILVPYLRAAGFRFHPRFDFRGTGLSHTLRLGVWTVLFVIVNQIAYTVVVRLASGGTAGVIGADCAAAGSATGYTVYSSAYLLVMVPHAIVTVSLSTAILPRLSASAADADLPGLAATLSATLRTTLALVLPFALVLPVVAVEISQLVWGYGANAGSSGNFAPSLALFTPGLLFFTVHYLMLRGFYALERTRTVFWIQCAVSATNIALAFAFVRGASAHDTSPALVLAYGGSYLVGATVSYLLLRRVLGGLQTSDTVRFLVRMVLAAGVATAISFALATGLRSWFDGQSRGSSVVIAVLVIGLDGLVFVVLARLLRIQEVSEVVGLVTSRLPAGVTRRLPGRAGRPPSGSRKH
ncbi:murein biosynthesis integral membrane protein MurJ [Nocardioides sp.]|uniref:murein biosynthesis integral membrane protein MurJ n=1 Tax=Nocardioides sp. TaxID=35761 RepID=UPI003D1118BA